MLFMVSGGLDCLENECFYMVYFHWNVWDIKSGIFLLSSICTV